MRYLQYVLAALILISATSCKKSIRGELVITALPGRDYYSTDPRPTGPPKLADYDGVMVKQLLMCDRFWREYLAARLRKIGIESQDLLEWRDRHVSLHTGAVSQLGPDEFVCTYDVRFKEIDRETASKFLSLMAESYDEYATKGENDRWLSQYENLEQQVRVEEAALGQTTDPSAEKIPIQIKIKSMKEKLETMRDSKRRRPQVHEVKSSKIY